jgi:predicted membrane-bound spermidine synthase
VIASGPVGAGRLAAALRTGPAFAAGLVATVVEFAAVRQMAPAYGQTNLVWASAIGMVLLGLAAGAALGGSLADRARTDVAARLRLALATTVGAAASVVVAFAGPAIAAALRPGLPAGGLAEGGTSSALRAAATALILYVPLAAAAGVVSPFLVRREESREAFAGGAAGRVFASGTAGSLVGCWLAPLWSLPRLGTASTFLAAGGCLAAIAVHALARRGSAVAAPGMPPPAPPAPGADVAWGGAWRAGAAAVVGFAALAAEFAAVRLFAPWFGQSPWIWANAVGVVCLALALGSAIGGRLAARASGGANALSAALLGSGVLLAVAAVAGPALAEALAPVQAAADRPLPLSFWGSLAATTALFGPATLALGCAAPVLVRRGATRDRAGRVAGRISSAGTIGSLLGCFAAPAFLLPAWGSRATLCACGALVALVAALRFLREGGRARIGGAVALLAAAGAGFLPATIHGPLRSDEGQIEERETGYQTVRVAQDEMEGPAPGGDPFRAPIAKAVTRYLRFDEDVGSYQSVVLPEAGERLLTAGRYYDHLALGAWFDGMPWTATPPRAPRVLVVGYAGGTLHRTLETVAPAGLPPRVVGVELDPEVVSLARAHLGLRDLEGPDLTLLSGEDGRTVVDALPATERFDLILVDAYTRTQYVPFQASTVEFFRACASHLTPTGAIGVNVNASKGIHTPLLEAISATLLEVLDGRVWLVPNAQYVGNCAVWGRASAGMPTVSAPRLHPALEGPRAALDRLAVRFSRWGAGAVALTDDRAPVERLADEELLSLPEAK